MSGDVSELEWLMGVILGAATAIPPADKTHRSRGKIRAPSGSVYEIFGVGEKNEALVETDGYRLYISRLPSNQLGLMKIARSDKDRDALEKEAKTLQRLQRKAASLDAENTGRPYNYGAFFPAVIESMDSGDHRFLMFLGFHPSIAGYQQLQPLSKLLYRQRVDLKSVVWILGKSLKVLDFAHRLSKTAIGFVDASNLLVETEQHGTLFLDWSHARPDPTVADCETEAAALADISWRAAGGTDEGEPPYDAHLMDRNQHGEFVDFLRWLRSGNNDSLTAHERLYEMANRFWPKEVKTDEFGTVTKRPFHPWVTYDN